MMANCHFLAFVKSNLRLVNEGKMILFSFAKTL